MPSTLRGSEDGEQKGKEGMACPLEESSEERNTWTKENDASLKEKL